MTYVSEGSVLAIGILFIVLGTTAVVARFSARTKGKIALAIDDWLCLPALTLVVAEGIIMIIGSATHTVGSHSPPGLGLKLVFEMDPRQLLLEKASCTNRNISQFAFDIMQVPALALIKLSILFLYRRIFRGRAFNMASWILIGTEVAWGLTFVIAQFAACGTSLAAQWSSLASLKGKCVNTFDILITLSAFDVAVDLAILIMPIPLVLSLQMAVRRKVAVLGVLLLGTLAIACGLTRMIIFIEVLGHPLLVTSTVAGVPSDDDIGVVSILLFWGMMEMGVAMIAICLPTLRPILQNRSLESIVRSVHSAISLRSMGSDYKSPLTAERVVARSESETAITGPPPPGLEYWHQGSLDVEIYAMGEIVGKKAQTRTAGPATLKETQILHSSESLRGLPSSKASGNGKK